MTKKLPMATAPETRTRLTKKTLHAWRVLRFDADIDIHVLSAPLPKKGIRP
jgi:hypothetical protein